MRFVQWRKCPIMSMFRYACISGAQVNGPYRLLVIDSNQTHRVHMGSTTLLHAVYILKCQLTHIIMRAHTIKFTRINWAAKSVGKEGVIEIIPIVHILTHQPAQKPIGDMIIWRILKNEMNFCRISVAMYVTGRVLNKSHWSLTTHTVQHSQHSEIQKIFLK